MADIKTRDAVKGTIKTIDKAAVASERMKSAYAKTKDKAEQSYYAEENSATEYAADKISHTTERVTAESVYQFDKQGQKGVRTTRENIVKAKDKVADFKQNRAMKAAQTQKANAAGRGGSQFHHGTVSRSPVPNAPAQSVKNARQTQKTIKQSARNSQKAVKTAAKGTVKTTQKSVKTAQATSKAAIKTAQTTAKTTQAAAKASAKAAQRTAQVAKATAKATAAAVKASAKATVAVVKAIIAGTKALIAAIAAGGWIAVVVIIVICLIGLLVSSVFGIFFSGEDSGTGMTMPAVVREINTEYDNRLEEIKNGTAHDVLEMSGSRAVWKEVLAVYSVKTTTDPDNPQEVATMDESKKQLLTDIFWAMNEISSRTETQVTETDDGHGNIVQTETTVTRTYLYITVAHKTAEQMADQYGFNEEQRQQLSELLAEENNSLWSQVLYGITGGDGEIVTVALSQVGNVGGQPYWSWYGFDGRVEWCACFVSWCANECGYIDAGVIPKFAGCVLGSQWFKDRGQWQDGSFTPEAGHIIFFDWEGDGETDHVGIVERVENGTVYTVEGNSGDACRQNSYAIGSSVIYGYGIPAY